LHRRPRCVQPPITKREQAGPDIRPAGQLFAVRTKTGATPGNRLERGERRIDAIKFKAIGIESTGLSTRIIQQEI